MLWRFPESWNKEQWFLTINKLFFGKFCLNLLIFLPFSALYSKNAKIAYIDQRLISILTSVWPMLDQRLISVWTGFDYGLTSIWPLLWPVSGQCWASVWSGFKQGLTIVCPPFDHYFDQRSTRSNARNAECIGPMRIHNQRLTSQPSHAKARKQTSANVSP